ncbi:MAG TPA: TMEM175 family protein [Flavobacterium sp.]|jgi:uncharacterized membrane protein
MSNLRISTLVDGVFAIVMTLLVFDIDTPNIKAPKVDLHLWKELIKLWPKLITYIISFIVLGIFWISHHQQFKFIIRTDRNLLWMNILFLMAVAFIPFSAALISQYPASKEAIMIYGINLLTISSILYFHWEYATYRYRLIKNALQKEFISKVKHKILLTNAYYILAIALSFYSTYLSLAIFILITLSSLRPNRFDNYGEA